MNQLPVVAQTNLDEVAAEDEDGVDAERGEAQLQAQDQVPTHLVAQPAYLLRGVVINQLNSVCMSIATG